jgi:hypothetical protein
MTRREGDPDHPILPEARKHEIVGFHYDGLADEPYLDLELRHAETKAIRRLRFFSPSGVNIKGVPPVLDGGLVVADVRQRQLWLTGVRVYSFEPCPDTFEFWARDVVDATER